MKKILTLIVVTIMLAATSTVWAGENQSAPSGMILRDYANGNPSVDADAAAKKAAEAEAKAKAKAEAKATGGASSATQSQTINNYFPRSRGHGGGCKVAAAATTQPQTVNFNNYPSTTTQQQTPPAPIYVQQPPASFDWLPLVLLGAMVCCLIAAIAYFNRRQPAAVDPKLPNAENIGGVSKVDMDKAMDAGYAVTSHSTQNSQYITARPAATKPSVIDNSGNPLVVNNIYASGGDACANAGGSYWDRREAVGSGDGTGRLAAEEAERQKKEAAAVVAKKAAEEKAAAKKVAKEAAIAEAKKLADTAATLKKAADKAIEDAKKAPAADKVKADAAAKKATDAYNAAQKAADEAAKKAAAM